MVVSLKETEDVVKQMALEQPRIKELLAGKILKKVFIVPGRTINLVVVDA
jgi:leucyl-tRNA synthetase